MFGKYTAKLEADLKEAKEVMEAYVVRRDAEAFTLRTDYENRLLERDKYVADLKEEISLLRNKVTSYEMVLIPLASPAGAAFGNILNPQNKPTFESDISDQPSSWETMQAEFEKQQQVEAAAEAQAKNSNEVNQNA